MDFTEFCFYHCRNKSFRVRLLQLDVALKTLEAVGDRKFSGSEAARACGHGNIGGFLQGLCIGKVLIRVTKSTKVYQYQFNKEFVRWVADQRVVYLKEQQQQTPSTIQAVG